MQLNCLSSIEEEFQMKIESKNEVIKNLKNSIVEFEKNLNFDLNKKKQLEIELNKKESLMKQIESKLQKNEKIEKEINSKMIVDLTKEEINFQLKHYNKIKNDLSKELNSFNKIQFEKIEKKKIELKEFKQKLEYINIGISKFKDSINSSKLISDKVNEETFEKINSKFQIYFTRMIPNKIASIKKIGLKIEDGIEFMIKNSINDTICPYNEVRLRKSF